MEGGPTLGHCSVLLVMRPVHGSTACPCVPCIPPACLDPPSDRVDSRVHRNGRLVIGTVSLDPVSSHHLDPEPTLRRPSGPRVPATRCPGDPPEPHLCLPSVNLASRPSFHRSLRTTAVTTNVPTIHLNFMPNVHVLYGRAAVQRPLHLGYQTCGLTVFSAALALGPNFRKMRGSPLMAFHAVATSRPHS